MSNKIRSRTIPNGEIPSMKTTNGVANHNGQAVESRTITNTPTDNDLPDLITHGLRERMQEMRKDVLDHVSDRLNDMVSEILQKVEMVKLDKTRGLVNSNTADKYRDKIKSAEGLLPSKQFLERNSMLTELYQDQHIKTIYNIFMVLFILLFAHTAIHDIVYTGSTRLAIDTIQQAFGKLSSMFHIWAWMKASTLSVYVAFCLWSYQRQEYAPKSVVLKIWDYVWLSAFVVYQITFIILSTKAVLDEDLPVVSSVIVLMEQARMLMKTHAFVRSCAPRFLSYKPHAETPAPRAPSFSHFLYFMFAPTLVYQNSYPRTRRIRWNVVVYNWLEVIMAIFFCAFMFERLVFPSFEHFGTPQHDRKALIINTFKAVVPGMLFFLCGFYIILHSWLNAFAELLRFGDRLFYKDWWNSTSYSSYYRTWNVVVHDWLYTYIYKDMYEIVTPRNKVLSTSAVFLISAIFHEHILGFTFRFFYPVLLLMFGGLGFPLVFVAKRTGNIFLWLSLTIGNGVLISLYSMEYYARKNCPSFVDGLADVFIPRSWFCPSLSS